MDDEGKYLTGVSGTFNGKRGSAGESREVLISLKIGDERLYEQNQMFYVCTISGTKSIKLTTQEVLSLILRTLLRQQHFSCLRERSGRELTEVQPAWQI
jgi:hypothetical protein